MFACHKKATKQLSKVITRYIYNQLHVGHKSSKKHIAWEQNTSHHPFVRHFHHSEVCFGSIQALNAHVWKSLNPDWLNLSSDTQSAKGRPIILLRGGGGEKNSCLRSYNSCKSWWLGKKFCLVYQWDKNNSYTDQSFHPPPPTKKSNCPPLLCCGWSTRS